MQEAFTAHSFLACRPLVWRRIQPPIFEFFSELDRHAPSLLKIRTSCRPDFDAGVGKSNDYRFSCAAESVVSINLECAYAPPARISAATQTTSINSSGVAPACNAALEWPLTQGGNLSRWSPTHHHARKGVSPNQVLAVKHRGMLLSNRKIQGNH